MATATTTATTTAKTTRRAAATPASAARAAGPKPVTRPRRRSGPRPVPEASRGSDAVFAAAAEVFRLLATPMRLKIISALCEQEKNVSQLLAEIDTTQPNMSQHLAALYRAGVLGRRREATQIYYRIGSERAALLCRAVCTQVAAEMEGAQNIPPAQRLVPLSPLMAGRG